MAEIAAAYSAASVAVAYAAIKLFNSLLDISFNITIQTSIIELQLTALTATDVDYAVATMDMIVEKMISSLQAIVDKKIGSQKYPEYTVYTLIDSDNTVRYVGRTKNYGKRMTAHKIKGGKNATINPGAKIDHLTKAQSRELEQTLMVYFHTRNWLQESGNNDINGVSPRNKNNATYANALIDLLKNEVDNEILSSAESIYGYWW